MDVLHLQRALLARHAAVDHLALIEDVVHVHIAHVGPQGTAREERVAFVVEVVLTSGPFT